jgi:peroxiredoxin Q/BCP
MLPIGSVAPDFSLPDDTGAPVTLRQLLSTGPVVLLFYPADMTPVCTRQACMVRDEHAALARAGIRAVAISPQSPQSKAAFRRAKSLTQVLLADESGQVARAYEARGIFGLPLPLGVRRVSYLVEMGEAGTPIITDVAHAEFRLGAHEALMRRAVARASSRGAPGGAAPAGASSTTRPSAMA